MSLNNALYSFLISLITTLAVVLVIQQFTAKEKQFAYANLDQIVKNYVVKLSKSDLSEQDKNLKTKFFSKELEQSFIEISQKYNLTIFTHKAVIEGALDITPLIKKQMIGGIK